MKVKYGASRESLAIDIKDKVSGLSNELDDNYSFLVEFIRLWVSIVEKTVVMKPIQKEIEQLANNIKNL